ncbi:MAG: VOC family protein [Deltaproteobacteria bacterium]|nr:VOC family protein [Deltaproteobacteria bacterium]
MNNPESIPELHHVAYVVPNIEEAADKLRTIFGAVEKTKSIFIQADNMHVAFLTFPGGRIELVAKPKGAFQNKGIVLHPDHVCFLCSDFDDRVKNVADKGGTIVRAPIASEAFQGRRMCFIHYRDAGLIEWVEK